MIKNYNQEITQIIDNWQEYLRYQKNYSKNTLDSYLNDLKNYLSFLNNYYSTQTSIEQIKSVDIRCIRSWLSSRSQNNFNLTSTARALSSVKNFYKYLEKKFNITCHSIFTVRSPKKTKSLPKALTKSEAEISLGSVEMLGDEEWIHYRNKALLTLIYASGLRISEALSITQKHLENLEFIKILGKGGKERIIPWITESKQLIEKYIKLLPYHIEVDEPIFRGKHGKPLQRAVFNKELMKLRRMLGLPEFLSSHAFRHSFATHLLENGANLRSIQDLLGHKSLSTTQRYTKINHSHLESVYEKAHPGSKNNF
ncbi:MAG: tyrosine recombinase XerC [Rickettsiaceae bacterium]|nr:tyrosine recombinase XerC [Rickettsiaceae bacterium]